MQRMNGPSKYSKFWWSDKAQYFCTQYDFLTSAIENTNSKKQNEEVEKHGHLCG